MTEVDGRRNKRLPETRARKLASELQEGLNEAIVDIPAVVAEALGGRGL